MPGRGAGKIKRPAQARIKTDQRDAERLVRLLMIDGLHAVRVPRSQEEALRDLVPRGSTNRVFQAAAFASAGRSLPTGTSHARLAEWMIALTGGGRGLA